VRRTPTSRGIRKNKLRWNVLTIARRRPPPPLQFTGPRHVPLAAQDDGYIKYQSSERGQVKAAFGPTGSVARLCERSTLFVRLDTGRAQPVPGRCAAIKAISEPRTACCVGSATIPPFAALRALASLRPPTGQGWGATIAPMAALGTQWTLARPCARW